MDWLSENLWAGWVSLAVVFGVLELVSLDFDGAIILSHVYPGSFFCRLTHYRSGRDELYEHAQCDLSNEGY